MRVQNFLLTTLLLMSNLYAGEPLAYPAARKQAISDDYHGTRIDDPYRWLEDDHSDETKAWAAAENKVTAAYLATIPQRDAIRARLKELWNFERVGLPEEQGGRWFFSVNSGLQDQAVLYVADSLDAPPRVLLDPNEFSKDGTVSLAHFRVSEDGKFLAYATSAGGSDWNEAHVRDVQTGKDRPDSIKWMKFSGLSWAKDGSGFYYSRYDEPKTGAALTEVNERQRLFFHRLGDEQSKDALVYERSDHPKWGVSGEVTEDGDYLMIFLSQGTDPKNRVFYKPLKGKNQKVVELLHDGDAEYDFIGNDGPLFFFTTDLDAPKKRIIAVDTAKPDRKNWREIVPESSDRLDGATKAAGKIVCTYMKDARDLIVRYDADGKNRTELKIPGIGSIGGLGGKEKDREIFYAFSSFTDPTAIYRLDIASGESKLWRKPAVKFDGSAYETKQVFFKSKDGTQVPMFIVHKKGIALDGSHRTLLYGYGGFQISMQPGFSVPRAVWLERGGIAVTVNLRGGGEYGREWHDAGRGANKQNVFDDFFGAAEKLIADGYTKPENLAIQGGSNGGLLVGACMTERPELFAAALPAVGVMDMLRFQKFTIGWAWESEYGSSSVPEQFKTLIKYSPYHNLKSGTKYPATLVTTADHDDRVVPAHSFKFAARLQEDQAKDGPPVLIRIDTSAGHGAGTSLSKVIERTADEWGFLENELANKTVTPALPPAQ